MYFWKITKYSPEHSDDEWTSISDVGQMISGKIFTMDEYLRTERAYIDTISLIAKCNQVLTFNIDDIEIYKEFLYKLNYKNGQTIDLDSALIISQYVLREEMWCKLFNPKMFVHFGYDYYMYIGSTAPACLELKKIRKMGLYVEQQVSPYEDKRTV